MIRPDTLSDGLKATKTDMLFSPLALPDIEIEVKKNGKEANVIARLKGVAVFDRKNRTTDYKQADSGYVSAWYLDEDYDGDCFVACQMFFDFKKAPNLKAMDLEVDPEEFKLQLTSLPFPCAATSASRSKLWMSSATNPPLSAICNRSPAQWHILLIA